MQQFVAEVAEGVAIADVIQREHVEWPVIDVLPQNVVQLRFISCFYGVSKWVYYTDLQLYSWIDQYNRINQWINQPTNRIGLQCHSQTQPHNQ